MCWVCSFKVTKFRFAGDNVDVYIGRTMYTVPTRVAILFNRPLSSVSMAE